MRILSTIFICIILSGCTAMAALKASGLLPSDGVSVDAQVGDRENSLGDNIRGENVNVKKNKFEGEAKEVTINELPWYFLLLFAMMCWMLPQPWVMYRRIKRASTE